MGQEESNSDEILHAVYGAEDVEIVIHPTVPAAHEEVTVKALKCGKHGDTEKPLACTREKMAYHTADIIVAMDEACETGREIRIEPTAQKPGGRDRGAWVYPGRRARRLLPFRS